ncbi:MAG: hypothetical protein MUE68_02320 [Bacteroidetes bacterium]|jgi:hypothetical protein|nr:hypothetical protein [Bacteroidota bacterium]
MTGIFARLLLILALPAALTAQDRLAYAKDVAPIIKKYCLPCHLAENENPSQLSMDSYEVLMKGGEHGDIVIPGKPEKSNLYIKLLPDPPFGKQMARNRKRLSEAELKLIYDWIQQGAKK